MAHADVDLVPDDQPLDAEVLAYQRAQAEQGEGVEHHVDVAVGAEHPMALAEETGEGRGVVAKLLEPAGVPGLAVAADDPPAAELHVLVHPRVGGVRDDAVDRLVREAGQEVQAVGHLDPPHRGGVRKVWNREAHRRKLI